MSVAIESLQSVFDRTFAGIEKARTAFTPKLTPREVGTIISVSTGIARVSGLPGVGFEELMQFPGDVFGIAFNVDRDEIGVVLLGDFQHLQAGAGLLLQVLNTTTTCGENHVLLGNFDRAAIIGVGGARCDPLPQRAG